MQVVKSVKNTNPIVLVSGWFLRDMAHIIYNIYLYYIYVLSASTMCRMTYKYVIRGERVKTVNIICKQPNSTCIR